MADLVFSFIFKLATFSMFTMVMVIFGEVGCFMVALVPSFGFKLATFSIIYRLVWAVNMADLVPSFIIKLATSR